MNEKIIKEFNDIKNNNKNKILNSYNFSLIFSFFILVLCLFIQIIIVNPIKNDINNIKNDIQQLKNNNNKIISKIIRNDELYLIENEIRKLFGKNITKFEPLFRASRDGYRALDFHNKCDGEINTIIFVKSKGGKRFGGFTRLSWNKKDRYKNSEKDFTFSLDNEKVYSLENSNSKKNIYCNYNDGPTFIGKYGFQICDNSDEYGLSQDFTYNQENYDYGFSNSHRRSRGSVGSNNIDYLAETGKFYVKDYEVFKIDF